MCTFILAWQVFADAPVVVGANRDERYDRPSEPPGTFREEPRVVAPRDGTAGGTWIGYNEYGLLAAVTNRWTDADLRGERSRGLLVADALGYESAKEAGRLVERSVQDSEYAGFNLVLADERAALLYEWDGRLRVRNFQPGVHVVVNVGADDDFDVPTSRAEAGRRQVQGTRRALADLQPEPDESVSDWRARAAATLGDHEYGFCVHGDGFGTRSSSLVTLKRGGAAYEFADGPPCQTDYERIDNQV